MLPAQQCQHAELTVVSPHLKSISTTAVLRSLALRYAAIVNDSAAVRVAIDIETLSAFLYLSQRATQRSAAVVEMVPIE